MVYRINLSGEVRIECDGQRLQFRTRKALELICFVALHGPVNRREVARQLWPDLDGERRLANLRLALVYVRKAAPGAVVADGQVLEFAGEIDSGSEAGILEGIDSPWAVDARAKHRRVTTDRFLESAEREMNLDVALMARDQDLFLQSPRILIAKIWTLRGEPAKAAAELREYVSLIRRHLGIDVSEDVFGKAGLPIPDAQKVPSALFESLTPKERAGAVLGQCPTWLAGGKLLHARSRIEQALSVKLEKSLRCLLLTWRARFETEAGEFHYALLSSEEAGIFAVHPAERLGREVEFLRAKMMLRDLDFVTKRIEELLPKKMPLESRADLCLIGSSAHYYLNQPVEAIRLASLSIESAEEVDSRFRIALAMSAMAGSLFLAGEFGAAADYAGRASEICGRYGMRVREAHALGLQGRSEEAIGDIVHAEQRYRRGIELVSDTDSLHVYAILVTYLGDLLVKTDRAKDGLGWLKKGAIARRRSPDLTAQSTSNRCIARGYLALGETASAEKYVRAALELAMDSHRDLEVAMNEVILAEISFVRNKKQDGLDHLKRAFPVILREHGEGRSARAEDPIFDPERIRAILRNAG
jgi:tetratricopeptide (TPR) repeat protein